MYDPFSEQFNELPCGPPLGRIVQAALKAASPEVCIRRAMKCLNGRLEVGKDVFDLKKIGRIFILGAGKAVIGMAKETTRILGDISYEGLIVCKSNPANEAIRQVRILLGDHPIPGPGSLRAAKETMALSGKLTKGDLVLFLVSGGTSALLAKPEEPLTLRDLQTMTKRLIGCGADIHEINTVRKQLDAVKGGKLGRSFFPADVITLAISDVAGDVMADIGSGPTIASRRSSTAAWKILEKYRLLDDLPEHLYQFFENCRRQAENVIRREYKKRERSYVLANNRTAVEAAAEQAKKEGLHCKVLPKFIQGEASRVGARLAEMLLKAHHKRRGGQPPVLIIAGGESTVSVQGSGKGGRNQELVLGAVQGLAGSTPSALLSIATDGEDGETLACGAFATNQTLARAQKMHLRPDVFLRNNDSYRFFEKLGGLIQTGPTGTNVNDLMLLLLA
jgi:glycerate 2-kinase